MEATTSHMSNFEAVINICANVIQIAGLRNGFGFLMAGFFILNLKNFALAGKYLALGTLLLVLGFAAPGLINMLFGAVGENGPMSIPFAVICGLVAALAFVVTLALFIYPVRVAKSRGVTDFKAIMICSAVSLFFVPLWSVSLFLAHKKMPAGDDGVFKDPPLL